MVRALICTLFVTLAAPASAQDRLPAGFAFLRDVDPTIAQDMRYAGPNNFVGRPLPGYDGRECVLRAKAAEALKRVQADLARSGLSLKVYDCYRPARAVRAFAQWAQDGRSDGVKQFYPTLQKETLFRSGYISAASLHSNGTAVDLTLIPAQSTTPVAGALASSGPCTAPAAQRAPDNSLDMGTGFDCFDTKSYTRSPAIDAGQQRSRETLLTAMTRHGFKNYFREWWHFAYPIGETPQQFDFPIPLRR